MSHITEARESVNKVVSLLVGRFGSQEDVFGHLTDALRHLGEAEDDAEKAVPAPQVHPEQPVRTEPEPETLTTSTDTDEGLVYVPAAPPEPKERAVSKPKRTARRTRKTNK